MKKVLLVGLVAVAALAPASTASAGPKDAVKCIVLYDGDPIGLVGCVA